MNKELAHKPEGELARVLISFKRPLLPVDGWHVW